MSRKVFLKEGEERLYFSWKEIGTEGVYAILVENVITYVGETGDITERIYNYCAGTKSEKKKKTESKREGNDENKKGTTNEIHKKIKKEIKNGKNVEIFFLGSSEIEKLNLKLNEYVVPVERKVIERALINLSNPEWNKS